MRFEISIAHHRSNEAGSVLHAHGICLGIGTIEREVEVEVGEILLELEEIFEEEDFIDSTRAVEIVHFAVTHVFRLEQVHDLRTKRSHTGTTADPNHFTFRIVVRVELTVRTTHHHFVAGFQTKDVGRSDTGHDILKSGALFFRFEGRRRNAHGKRDDISFIRIVCHGVGADRGFGVYALQSQETELFPSGQIQITDQALIDVLIIVHREGRNLNLRIGSRLKVHVFSRR